jgi:hypothetical protein
MKEGICDERIDQLGSRGRTEMTLDHAENQPIKSVM